MPKFAANLSFLFTEVPFPERFRAAADAGFKGIEYLFPYVYEAAELKAWKDEAGLFQALINMPAGDWEKKGERGITCLPDRKGEFREGVGRAIDYARTLGCPKIHLVAGLAPAGGPERKPFEDTYRENAAWAADELAKHGLMAVIEPINGKRDVPGFFLQTVAQARAILKELGRPNLKVQFDAYHAQIMEGDLTTLFRACVPDLGHIQIANPPDRHEPDRGEINYPFFFEEVDKSCYDGWIGCEYKPRAGTRPGLGWGKAWGLKT